MNFNDGAFYSGDWFDGIPHGERGTFRDQFQLAIGSWEYGGQTGQGILEWLGEKIKYEGDIVDSVLHGYGSHTGPRPAWSSSLAMVSSEGNWKFGRLDGYATCVFDDGSSYAGMWVGDDPHGEGTMQFKDGSKFVGNWGLGLQATGTLISSDGTRSVKGVWENGSFVDARLKNLEELSDESED